MQFKVFFIPTGVMFVVVASNAIITIRNDNIVVLLFVVVTFTSTIFMLLFV